MKILNEWDWKYRIFLSEEVNAKVNAFIEKLKTAEQDIYKGIADFYRGFYSFDMLLEMLQTDAIQQEQLLSLAEGHSEKALRIPGILETYYIEKIDETFSDVPFIQARLKELLANIISDESYKNTDSIQGLIFGKYYDDIKKEIMNVGPIFEKTEHYIEIGDINARAIELIESVKSDPHIVEKFGEYCIQDFDIDIVAKIGFAEWWDKDLLGKEKDLLVLYDNKDALNTIDFEYTIYHEVYPGHGQFYNFARKYKDAIPCFDHGAMSLVEGWATFSEWNVKESAYAQTLKNRGKNLLNLSLCMSDDNGKIKKVYDNYVNMNYSRDQALNVVRYLTQYPGFLESYYLGALCIEIMIEKGPFDSPVGFLEYLKDKTWGELFALWG